ncbi:hypothetical protein ENVG_00236 [Emiliania huxleyi virus 84]|nr:hypothetical protein ENVG_00236 [Emiliania huxleyi virus 84]AEP15247.1 hypothetical protein EOVG_00310 [Emiliania huxleyi virus 88]
MSLFIALPFIVVSIVILAVISIKYFNKRRARPVHMPVIRVAAHNTSPPSTTSNEPPSPMRRSSANVSRRTSADYDMSAWMSPLVSSGSYGSYARLPGDPLSRRSSTPSLPRYRVSGNSFGEWSGN